MNSKQSSQPDAWIIVHTDEPRLTAQARRNQKTIHTNRLSLVPWSFTIKVDFCVHQTSIGVALSVHICRQGWGRQLFCYQATRSRLIRVTPLCITQCGVKAFILCSPIGHWTDFVYSVESNFWVTIYWRNHIQNRNKSYLDNAFHFHKRKMLSNTCKQWLIDSCTNNSYW